MPRPQGHLDPPAKGRPYFTFRIRVGKKQRRYNLETTAYDVAIQRRDDVLRDIAAELAEKPHVTHAQVRKLVSAAGKSSRTVPAVAERYCDRQRDSGRSTSEETRSKLRRYVCPLWTGDVSRYQAQHVASLLDGVKGLAHATRLHIHSAISGMFEQAILEGLIDSNPCRQVQRRKLVPQKGGESPKVRVTLTPREVETTCGWQHPEEQHRPATERLQGKLRVAFYTGLRHKEVASLRWEDFDGADFTLLTVYRAKKKDPAKRRDALDLSQLHELRSRLKRLHEAAGKPSAGLLFPAVRDGKTAEAGKSKASGLSEAEGLRRLYKRAHGIEARVTSERELTDKRVKAGKRTVPITEWKQVREMTERERLVLEGSERVAPVCFHASRHAFAQALDAAGMADEAIREVLDHENVRVTQGYLRSIGARSKLLPNVHQLAPLPAAQPSADPAGNEVRDQTGHEEEPENDISAHPVGFEPTTLGFEVLPNKELETGLLLGV